MTTRDRIGSGASGTPVDLSKAISPGEFASECASIVSRHRGHRAHRLLDRLVTETLSSLGYSEGMAIFLSHVSPFHDERPTHDRP